MLDINSIQGVTGTQRTGDATRPTRQTERTGQTAPQDSVVLSDDSERAGLVQRIISESEQESEIRTERVEEARANLEQGIQSVNEVLEVIASRVTNFI